MEQQPRVQIPGYRILEVRGVGAMATVYRALQKRLKREVALKTLHDFVAQDPDYRQRFLREAKAAARLNHDNVVRAYEAGIHNGIYYFAMEYVEGEDLSERLEHEGSLSEDEALRIAIEVTKALQAAQAHGMVHRDVKPENILLGDDGSVKLADLGLAKVAGDGMVTAEGFAVGTVAFFSPEQCRGVRDLDVRSDLFALGGVLYTMLTGELPFGRGDNPVVTMKRILEEEAPGLDDPSKFSPALRQAIRSLMAREREDRPADARAAEELLRRALLRLDESEVQTVEGRDPAQAEEERERRRLRRRRRPGSGRRSSGALTAVIVVALLLLALLLLLPRLQRLVSAPAAPPPAGGGGR